MTQTINPEVVTGDDFLDCLESRFDPVLDPSHHRPSTSTFIKRPSRHDASVNWVRATDVGMIEARYVRRGAGRFIVYLSSQTGCDQACRMCHLTAFRQTEHRDVTLDEYLAQAEVVLRHHRATGASADIVHFNFMARGEPLLNPVLIQRSDELLGALWDRARADGLRSRFLVSTIFPKGFEGDLNASFDRYRPDMYYSLYSTDVAFRRRWLPKAQSVESALGQLANWQRESYKIVKIHYAFIEDENDSADAVHAVCDAIERHRLFVHINVVRYNPARRRHGRESSRAVLERNVAIFTARLPQSRVQVVDRVGPDVHASCGMFATS